MVQSLRVPVLLVVPILAQQRHLGSLLEVLRFPIPAHSGVLSDGAVSKAKWSWLWRPIVMCACASTPLDEHAGHSELLQRDLDHACPACGSHELRHAPSCSLSF